MVAAFEQSLSNMTSRLQHLTASAEQKVCRNLHYLYSFLKEQRCSTLEYFRASAPSIDETFLEKMRALKKNVSDYRRIIYGINQMKWLSGSLLRNILGPAAFDL